jgi:hypothetical protein
MSSPWWSTQARASCAELTLSAKAGLVAAKIVGIEIVHRADPPREEAAAERAIGDEADSELTHSGEDLVLGIAAPKRVLGLERSDRVNGVGAADRLRGRFG